MRRVLTIGALCAMALAGAAQAVAAPPRDRDFLVMPYACTSEGGRLAVRSVPDLRRYAIVSDRAEQPVTVCRNAESSDCRTIMVHRFSIACGAETVPWVKVAAEMKGRFNRVWLDGSRLNLTLATGRSLTRPKDCERLPHHLISASSSDGAQVLAGECLPWRRRRTDDVIALPPGYAPVGEMGARLGLKGGAAPEAEASAAGLVPAVATSADVEAGVVPVAARADAAVAGWVTIVAPEADRSGLGLQTLLAWLLAASAALAALALAAQSRLATLAPSWDRAARAASLRLAARAQRVWTGLAQQARAVRSETAAAPAAPVPPGTPGAVDTVTAQLVQARLAVAALKGAVPLREVLDIELQTIRQRLAVVSATASEGGEAAARAAPAFRALVRDLDRIRRIADSANTSLSGSREAVQMPRSPGEAYELLGVNPDVSEATLKKVVDALRMSWHPDLARSEDDRLLREERSKQINVAWDLIAARRTAPN